MAKVTSVAHSAIQRAVPRASRSFPRTSNVMSSAPSSGRNVTTERIGQFMIQCVPVANMNQVMNAAAPISMAKA